MLLLLPLLLLFFLLKRYAVQQAMSLLILSPTLPPPLLPLLQYGDGDTFSRFPRFARLLLQRSFEKRPGGLGLCSSSLQY